MPHFMKKYLFIIISVATFAMTSCNTRALSTPSINATIAIRTSPSGQVDTVPLNKMEKDTMHVGDTMRLGLLLNGHFNYLTSFEAHTTNTACLSVSLDWNHALDSLLAEGSDPDKAKLFFLPERVGGCITTLKYVALKEGDTRIEMTIASDAGEPYSPVIYTFDVPVRDTVPSNQ